MRQDKDIQTEVMRELEWEPSVDAAAIGVAASDGAITLTGHVGSYAEKIAATKAARRVYGVRAVADELAVELPTENLHDDTDIAETISRLLEWNVTIPKRAVTAKVSNGFVTLDGKVDWEYQSIAATKLVRNLTGVRGVTNLVTVRPKVHDKEVKSGIAAALHRQAQLDARRIWLETSDGTVTLQGQVSSWSESETARKAAAAAPGVRKVENHLQIVA
ncbi:MAG TPA: BON domain-containing protein [Candidatus Acidoferrales bacterium]|nr:BON domain-containing protein [Candidatus Acidoferrales bacterium]